MNALEQSERRRRWSLGRRRRWKQRPLGPGAEPPRGGGGGRGNGGPPDLEEIFRRGQDQLKGVVPGGFNGGVVAIIGLPIVGFVLMNSIYTVQPDERGVEMRFGKPKGRDFHAGFALPFLAA